MFIGSYRVMGAWVPHQRCLNGVPTEFQECFKDATKMLLASLKGCSKVFNRFFRGVQGSFKGH